MIAQPSGIPSFSDLLWPTIKAIVELGGSASTSEIVETVIRQQDFTEEQQSVLHVGGPKTEIAYRLAWARTSLRYLGLIANSSRGVWALTEEGAALAAGAVDADENRHEQVRKLWAEYLAGQRSGAEASLTGSADSLVPAQADAEGADGEPGWKEQLLGHLMGMAPDAFERLTQRLLREADFDNVTVTGKTGDGGIDGVGVYRLGLVSFPVFFQCKRYRGSVGSSVVRDFRGAMAGRGDKGLVITTGTFTAEAKKEASRDGAPPVDLIDGDRLCDLLKQYELGVRTVTRTVEDVFVSGEFFEDL